MQSCIRSLGCLKQLFRVKTLLLMLDRPKVRRIEFELQRFWIYFKIELSSSCWVVGQCLSEKDMLRLTKNL